MGSVEANMQKPNDWVLDVLQDLRDFSKQNKLGKLHLALDEIVQTFDLLTEEKTSTYKSTIVYRTNELH